MRSVLVAVGGVQLRKALTQEAVHGRLSAGLVVAVTCLAVPTTAVLHAKLIHLIQRVPGGREIVQDLISPPPNTWGESLRHLISPNPTGRDLCLPVNG